MNKLIRLTDCSLKKFDSDEKFLEENLGNERSEKVLCNHCGRTSSNGIRCLGICVADNEY